MRQIRFSSQTFIPLMMFILLLALSACQGQANPTATNPEDESEITTATDTAIVNLTIEPTDTPLPDPSLTLIPTDTLEPSTPEPEVVETETPISPTETKASSEPTGDVSFIDDVLPIFQNSCTRCHGSSKVEEGLRLNTYVNVMVGSDEGPVIIAGDPVGSLLVQVVSDGSMPKRGENLTPEEIEIIKAWILAGAKDN